MKKSIALLLCAAVLFALAGCGGSAGSAGRAGNQPTGVKDVLNAETTEQNSQKESATRQEQNGTKKANAAGAIDVDLTALSSTLVYSEVYHMMSEPKDYLGKTVKMNGKMAVYHDNDTGKDYYACIVSDATACCSQGIEFVLRNGYSYPNKGDDICVVGVFTTYQEGENTYCTLKNASLA
ncbi:MAG: hypothetical protein IJU96_00425 [Clostridia bacterium]|nr:hypothetical protein [Clostridia bacterium]